MLALRSRTKMSNPSRRCSLRSPTRWIALVLAWSCSGGVNAAPLVALCMSGQLRGAETRTAALADTKRRVAAALGPTRVFASIHVNSGAWEEGTAAATTAAYLAAVVGALSPVAHEVYDSGAFQCAVPGGNALDASRGSSSSLSSSSSSSRSGSVMNQCGDSSEAGGNGVDARQACTFLTQFTGVWRSWRLVLEDEARTGTMHTLAVRLRFDVACVNWEALPSVYPALLKSASTTAPGPAQKHIRRRRHSSHNQEAVYFLGSARRSLGQQVSAYDWSDFGWIVSRAAAETVFGVVHEYGTDGCGRLMHPVELEAACVSAANHSQQCQARPSPSIASSSKLQSSTSASSSSHQARLGTTMATTSRAADSSWLPVTRCKFYECIVNARLHRLHGPKAVWLNPLDSGWKCNKLTDDHEKPATSTAELELGSPLTDTAADAATRSERIATRREKRLATSVSGVASASPTAPEDSTHSHEDRTVGSSRRMASPQCAAMGALPPPSFLAVVARWDEDVEWAKTLPMPAAVYEHAKGPSSVYNVPLNKGSEASAYLQFIVDHYMCMPAWVLFLHGHGQTLSVGPPPGSKRHHPTQPASVASLIDVAALAAGEQGSARGLGLDKFIGLGHFGEQDSRDPRTLHPVAQRWSASAAAAERRRIKASGSGSSGDTSSGNVHGRKRGSIHRAAFVPLAEGKKGCSCALLKRILPSEPCTARSWPVGAEFWVSRAAILARPLDFWRNALKESMSGGDMPRFGSSNGSKASPAGYCFEALWPTLFSGARGDAASGGEKARRQEDTSILRASSWAPAFRFIEELPTVTFEARCKASAGSALSARACERGNKSI